MPIRKVRKAYKAYKAKKTAKVMKRAAKVKGNVDRAISKNKSKFRTTQEARNMAKGAIKLRKVQKTGAKVKAGLLVAGAGGGYAYGRSKSGKKRTAGKYVGVGLLGGVGGLAGYHAASGKKKKKKSSRRR